MEPDLRIKRVRFHDFRNYQAFEINDLARLVVIVGNNALGKTNIIEGVQLLSMIDSFRKPAWNDVVRKGCESALLSIEYHQNGCDNSIVLKIQDNKRSYLMNEKARRTRDLFGLLPAVLFTPGDLQIIQGPAERRRSCIDDLGCQISKTFADIKSDYARVVKQKNTLLRAEPVDPDILASWNRNLVKLGSALMTHRIALFERVLKKTQAVYHRLAPDEELTATYVFSWENEEGCGGAEAGDVSAEEFGGGAGGLGLSSGPGGFEASSLSTSAGAPRALGTPGEPQESSAPPLRKEGLTEKLAEMVEKHQQTEINRGRACIGPHRDEISFFINGSDARRFGSQGQQRSIALALKIAEVEVLREVTGVEPILLLDDVMSEIDAGRRAVLLDLIDASTQTLITTTNLSYFDDHTLQRAQVIRLPLEENHRGDADV